MDTLTWFLLAAKPEWANPMDVLVTVYLMARMDAEGNADPKLADMAKACSVARSVTVRDSLRRLEEHKWITTTFRSGVGLPNLYHVNVENLPRWDQQVLKGERNENRQESE